MISFGKEAKVKYCDGHFEIVLPGAALKCLRQLGKDLAAEGIVLPRPVYGDAHHSVQGLDLQAGKTFRHQSGPCPLSSRPAALSRRAWLSKAASTRCQIA